MLNFMQFKRPNNRKDGHSIANLIGNMDDNKVCFFNIEVISFIIVVTKCNTSQQ